MEYCCCCCDLGEVGPITAPRGPLMRDEWVGREEEEEVEWARDLGMGEGRF